MIAPGNIDYEVVKNFVIDEFRGLHEMPNDKK